MAFHLRERAPHSGADQPSPSPRTVNLPDVGEEARTRTWPPSAPESPLDVHGPTLDLLPAHAAVLDRQGVIRLTNRAWEAFADANGLAAPDGGRGLDYLAACDAAKGDDAGVARAVALGLRQVPWPASGRASITSATPATRRAASAGSRCRPAGSRAGARSFCTTR